MAIYLLTRTDRPGWDENLGLVVRAKDEREARALAAEQANDEGADIWWNPKTACTPVELDGPSDTILVSFRAG